MQSRHAVAVGLVGDPGPGSVGRGCPVAPSVPTSGSGLAEVPSGSNFGRIVVHVGHVPTHAMGHHLPASSKLVRADGISDCLAGDIEAFDRFGGDSEDSSAPAIVEALVGNGAAVAGGIVVIGSG